MTKNTKKLQPIGYWHNYENNYQEAKKYKSRSEFEKGCEGAYQVARKNGWLDDYTWFIEKKKPSGYWHNYENNYNEAQKYKSRSEFKKGCEGAYRVARKNGWLDKYTWFTEKPKYGYWHDYENNYQEAKKYKSRKEFSKGCSGAYEVARKNGWLDDYTWFEKDLNPFDNNRDNVYCYKFTELHSIYVGRTIDINRRNEEHNTNEKCSVYKFAKQNNIPIPQITILETKLSLKEGRDKEDFYVNKYKQEGWNVLNKAKTGKNCGSLGALNNGKWNEKTCYKEAQKYKSRKEFEKGCGSAYNVARKNGWLDDYTWFEKKQLPNGYWHNYDNNYQEAKKYKSRKEFQKGCNSAYNVARKNGWLDKYTWVTEKPKYGYWTEKTCYQEALKYKSRNEFKKGCEGAYRVTLKNGWMDDYTWFKEKKKNNGYWNNYENNYQEARKYKSRREFQKGCQRAYQVARINGWLDNYTWFEEKKKPSGYWNYETCYQEAKKYNSRREFEKGCGSAYKVVLKNGWMDKYFPKVN